MKKAFTLLFVMILLSSCMSWKKQLERSTTFFVKNPEELAKLCYTKFPTKPDTLIIGKTDTVPGPVVYVKGDSVKCPDGSKQKSPDKVVKCPASTHRVDTVFREDPRKVFLFQSEIKRFKDSVLVLHTKLQESEKNVREARKQSQNRLFIVIGLIVLIVGGFIARMKGFL